jgi:hypothetical protein
MFEPNYKLEQTNVNLGAVKAVGTCVITNEVYSTEEFSLEVYTDWVNGNNPIQNTELNSLSDDDREFLISGMSPKAFNELDNN